MRFRGWGKGEGQGLRHRMGVQKLEEKGVQKGLGEKGHRGQGRTGSRRVRGEGVFHY